MCKNVHIGKSNNITSKDGSKQLKVELLAIIFL